MLIAEYSYEEDIEVKQQEARAEGKREGRREGKREGRREGRRKGRCEGKEEGMILSGRIFQKIKETPNHTDRQIADEIGCSIEEVKNVRKMFGI